MRAWCSPDSKEARLQLELSQAVVSGVVALVGWLLKRAIHGLDEKLDSVQRKLDSLNDSDGQHERRLVAIELRLEAHTERLREVAE
jgi:hypothetical protein